MFGLSFAEICVVLVVALLLLKPEDLPKIISSFQKGRKYLLRIKQDFLKEFETEKDIKIIDENQKEEANYYLLKIIEAGGAYNGNYDLENIKEFYYKILKETNKKS